MTCRNTVFLGETLSKNLGKFSSTALNDTKHQYFFLYDKEHNS